MRIVGLAEFLALPPETVFAKYEPCYVEELQIKGDSLPESRDFLYQDIALAVRSHDSAEFTALLDDAQREGSSVRFDFDCQGRDGCFEDRQLFAVWEPEDVRALIERLGRCLPATAALLHHDPI